MKFSLKEFVFGKTEIVETKAKIVNPKQEYRGNPGGLHFAVSFNGEKNTGEIGPVSDEFLEYYLLSLRGWSADLTNEIAHTILNKFKIWVIGSGLSLKSAPSYEVLKAFDIDIKEEDFNERTERLFEVWSKSNMSDYTGMNNLNFISSEAFKNAKIGGDVLTVLRLIDGIVKVEIIDGAHVQSPSYGSDWYPQVLPNGVRLINGVEIDATGKHIAYHVRCSSNSGSYKYERIPAYNNGFKVAYLVYGRRHRLNNVRGIPLITSSLETLAKIDRYREAMVGQAEELAKIALQIVHGRDSTGENPFQSKVLSKAFDVGAGEQEVATDDDGTILQNTVAVSTGKTVINNTPDSEIKPLTTPQGQFYFKEFLETNINVIAAGIGIPPNVAMSLYNDSFSASRTATKDWDHTLDVIRAEFTLEFLKPIYELFLHIEIMKNNIAAPGYLIAYKKGNSYVLNAYRMMRFTGKMFPHIDPVKEVKAERLKLGSNADHIPLTTFEQAVENLGGGDADSNMEQFSKEYEYADELGIEKPEPAEMTSTKNDLPKSDSETESD